MFTTEAQLAQLDALAALRCAEAQGLAAAIGHFVELQRLTDVEDAGEVLKMFPALELAGALRLGQSRALGERTDALRYASGLPLTVAGLAEGRVWRAQAAVLLQETGSCSERVAGEVERRTWADDRAGAMCPPDLRKLVTRTVVEAELEPTATAEREEVARSGRRVSVVPLPDAMAGLWAVLTAEQVVQHTRGLDELVRRQQLADAASGTQRTADQRRADVLAMLPALALHALDGTRVDGGHIDGSGGPAAASHLAVLVNVFLPMAAAIGLSEAPGHLEGYGPLGAAHVRRLLPDADLRKVCVDETGQPVHLDPRRVPGGGSHQSARRTLLGWVHDPSEIVADDTPEPRYRPSAGLDRLVRLRDHHCSGPGRGQRAEHSDLDHLVPHARGGKTAASNLGPRSRRCHNAKTHGGWTVARHPDGSHTWTSPLGRSYWRPAAWQPPPRISRDAVLRPPDDPALLGTAPPRGPTRSLLVTDLLAPPLTPPLTPPVPPLVSLPLAARPDLGEQRPAASSRASSDEPPF